LERLALAAADEWIDWWACELARDDRRMAGGWPGTMREARARFVRAAALGNEHVLEAATIDALSRRTYVAARARWLSRAAREPLNDR